MAIELLAEYKPGRNLYPNVEFGAAAVLRSVGLCPNSTPQPLRLLAVVAGQHTLEQAEHNRLIRPSTIYTGKWPKQIQDRADNG